MDHGYHRQPEVRRTVVAGPVPRPEGPEALVGDRAGQAVGAAHRAVEPAGAAVRGRVVRARYDGRAVRDPRDQPEVP